MSPSHKPRLSSAVFFALLFISFSTASPVANAERPRVSVIAASEPVNIIPVEDFPPEPSFQPPTITNDGTTELTTFNVPRKVVRKRQSLPNAGASEPVRVVPNNELPPGQIFGGSSNSTSDGTTVLTTFQEPATSSRGRNSGINSVNLLSVSNNTRELSELNMGLNCQGSVIMCVGAAQTGVMHTLRDYMYAIPQGYHYYAGQKIACMKHNFYPNPWITWGFYCAFMQGNISTDGEDGAVIQLKMQQMIEHHCLGCGSVPFSPDNDPEKSGILTVNYVRESECEGLCYYVPPGTPKASVKVPQGMTLAS